MKSLVQSAYDALLRPWLPRTVAMYNGVAVRNATFLDSNRDFPEYEAELVAASRRSIERDDDVLVIGGGLGVSTVASARAAGPGGSVTVIEGGKKQASIVEETIRTNHVRNAELRVGVVGEDVDVYDEGGVGEFVEPSDLPVVDVLVMDCEGAEQRILSEMSLKPRVIVVETHGNLGSPTDSIVNLLDALGYEVRNREAESADDDVFVLTSERA